MNYQDVTPDYLVYNSTVGALDVELKDQDIIFKENGLDPILSINYGLIQHVTADPVTGFITPVAATPAQWTITAITVANTTYSVNILQMIDGVALERQISYTTPAVPVANDAAKGLAAIINKLLSVGTFELTSATQLLDVVTVTATASNPSFTVSVGSNVTVANPVIAVPARGQGVDLVGIVGLNGSPVIAGNSYDKLVIDYQTDRIGLEGASRFQRKELIILVNTADADAGLFTAAVETILKGTGTASEYLALIN